MCKRFKFWLHTLKFHQFYRCKHCCIFCEYFNDCSGSYFGK